MTSGTKIVTESDLSPSLSDVIGVLEDTTLGKGGEGMVQDSHALSLEKLWGIGSITAQILIEQGIHTIEDIKTINIEELAESTGRPINDLAVAQYIANNLPADFIQNATTGQFPIAKKVWGVGRDLGLLLHAMGVKDLTDIPRPKPRPPRKPNGLCPPPPPDSYVIQIVPPPCYLPNRIKSIFNLLPSQAQLSLVPGLTPRHGYSLSRTGVRT
ncbi:unnamed protein product, partial [marine sediment metagenome]